MASLAYMPTVQRELMQKGATFTRFYAHVPVCCPSRSSLISGRTFYSHAPGTRAANAPEKAHHE
jgi:N-acetylglucosamine-6-sulfatase